jgi:hypothetical protein
MDIHALLESAPILEEVNAALRARKHQEIAYGDLKSMLHLHYLCHALEQSTDVYVQIGDGEMRRAVSTYQPHDAIGRVMRALVIKAE